MDDKAELIDPTVDFFKAIRRDARVRGVKIAEKLFGDCGWDEDVIRITGEVFGDIIACGVTNSIGSSLFDVPMQC